MAASRALSALGAGITALLALTACGGSSKDSAATTPTVASSTASTPTDSASTSAAPTTDGSASQTATESTTTAISTPSDDTSTPAPADSAACGNATVEVNKAINAIPEGDFVLDIEIEGACTVSVKTGYTEDKAADALTVCKASETAAYANGATGVSVTGPSGELAAGTKSSPCAAKV